MVRVHIRRSVAPENHSELMTLITRLRTAIAGQPGYISSETLKRVEPPGEVLVVSKWQSHFYWKQWYEKRERLEVQQKIDALLEAPTEYEIYEYE